MNLSNNIIKLDNYRKDKTGMDYFDPAPDLLDTVVIGWQEGEDGERLRGWEVAREGGRIY